MCCLSVKDDQQQVWQNLSLSLSLVLSVCLSVSPLAAQQCCEALLRALVFYNLLLGSFCCQQIAPEI